MVRHFANLGWRFYPFGIKIVSILSLPSLFVCGKGKEKKRGGREEVGRGGQASETLSTGSVEREEGEPPTVLATKEVRERESKLCPRI